MTFKGSLSRIDEVDENLETVSVQSREMPNLQNNLKEQQRSSDISGKIRDLGTALTREKQNSDPFLRKSLFLKEI